MDATNGTVLAAKSPHLRLPMASTTKVMTALLALKMGNLSDRITVPKAAFNFESDATVMGLHPGAVVTLRDLLYGLLLPSGADAANTIAIHYGGSEARFVTLMNAEAQALGMTDTHYANAHGLTATNHYTTAYDLAVLAQYVSYLPDLMKIVSTRSYAWGRHALTNLNKVLFWYPGVDGIKPGYTTDAGICQVLDAKRHGRHIVATILNTPDLEIDARNLLDFGLDDFSWAQSPLRGDGPSLVLNGRDANGQYAYFPGSGHYVRGAITHGYLVNGGLPVLGLPRTELLLDAGSQVQYFENGALMVNSKSGVIQRLALGLTPLPKTKVPPPTPVIPTPVPLPTFPTPGARGRSTRTPTPHPRSTPTPIPRYPTPAPPTLVQVAKVFLRFQKTHYNRLGIPAARAYHRHGYTIQVFAYGALLYDARYRTVWQLPIGDRILGARGFLPDYPGNAYPAGFASTAILKVIGWPPYAA